MSEEYQSLDPAARARYLAKLQVLGLKEDDDSFATWNDSRFEDNMSLWPPMEYPHVHLLLFCGASWGVHIARVDAVEKSRGIQLLQEWACAHSGDLARRQHQLYPESRSEPQPAISWTNNSSSLHLHGIK